ncbi:MAG: helix-turn-helix domain-containing protein [Pseudomonadota bacterium]
MATEKTLVGWERINLWQKLSFVSQLPAQSKHLVLYLATYMNAARQHAWPSRDTIAADTGMGKRTVDKYLSILIEAGWVVCKKSTGRGNSNCYYVGFPDEEGRTTRTLSINTLKIKGATGVRKGAADVRKGARLAPEYTKNSQRIINKENDTALDHLIDRSWAEPFLQSKENM